MPGLALFASDYYGGDGYGGYENIHQLILYGDGTSSGDDDEHYKNIK